MSTTAIDSDSSEKLPVSEKLAFGLGDFGNNLFWQFFMYFLLFFYTDVYKIAPGKSAAEVAGVMFLVVRTWDAFFDVIIGVIADRTKSRWGKYRPYLLFGALPFALSGILAFTTPNFSAANKIIYAYVTYSFLMMIYSLVSIPQNSLLGVMTPNIQERASLAKYKFAFAFSAGLVVQFFTPILADYFGDHGKYLGHGYQMALLCYAIVAFVLFLVCFAGIKERVAPPESQENNLGRDFLHLLCNIPWIVICLGTLATIMCIAVRSQTIIYYFKYYVGDQDVTLPFLGMRHYGYQILVSDFLVLGNIITIVGVLMVPFFTRLIGKKALYIVMVVGSSVLSLGFYVLRPEQIGLIFGLQILVSILQGPFCAVLWAMYADCADFHEWKNNRRATALVFAAGIMAQKFGWAFGGWFPGVLLTRFGYVADTKLGPQTVKGILAMQSTLPCAFGLIAVVIILFYGLPERRMKMIETELKARRVGAPQPA
jgi:GPH family glycoside/pentoside/hexuronide:cation symporter